MTKILTKENCGNLEKLKELGENKKNAFTVEQLLNGNLKNEDGENRIEVTKRMEEAFYRIKNDNTGKNIVIVSHGAAIKFLLMKWCKLNSENMLQFNNAMINLNSPGVIKLVFENDELIKIYQIM